MAVNKQIINSSPTLAAAKTVGGASELQDKQMCLPSDLAGILHRYGSNFRIAPYLDVTSATLSHAAGCIPYLDAATGKMSTDDHLTYDGSNILSVHVIKCNGVENSSSSGLFLAIDGFPTTVKLESSATGGAVTVGPDSITINNKPLIVSGSFGTPAIS